jgi:hypothetical protein
LNSSKPIIENKEKTMYISPKGMTQIVVGTGGVDIDKFSNHETFVAYQDDSGYGFLNIDLFQDGSILRGTYYANNGTKMDEFRITK